MLPLLLGGWRAQPPAAARPASGAPHSVPAPALNPVVEAQSFRAPFTAVNPFSGTHQLEHWEAGGSAVVHKNFIRLTGEKQSQKGWVTSRTPLALSEWSALLELRASGHSPHLYGDGLAIWLVSNPDHVEGNVFGREDHWNGLAIFFDTFQNLDFSHHHKHPYIYGMINDGSKRYVPDAEQPDPTKQAMPGSHDNSGCSYEFRYHEARHDVSVLNHTRVHLSYKDKTLRLRLQQTSLGEKREWHDCFEMKDVSLPSNLYFGISSATGDLVDNHDIIQFTTRSLAGVDDPIADYQKWDEAVDAFSAALIAEFDLRPAEALQRDYQRVIRAQSAAIKGAPAGAPPPAARRAARRRPRGLPRAARRGLAGMMKDVDLLKQRIEFQMAGLSTGLAVTKSSVDAKADDLRQVAEKVQGQEALTESVLNEAKTVTDLRAEIRAEVEVAASAHKGRFWFLFLLFIALAGVGYNRYRKIMKSHLL